MNDLTKLVLDPDKLRQAREGAGLTLEAAASQVGLTRQGLSRAEKSGNTSATVLLRLQRLYRISSEDVEGKLAA